MKKIQNPEKILILGVNGMLGFSIYHHFLENRNYKTYGTIRGQLNEKYFSSTSIIENLRILDINDQKKIEKIVNEIEPSYIINCIGIIKQSENMNDHKDVIFLNSILPHILSTVADSIGAKLIHFSTDCIFDGLSGNYTEADHVSAKDFYGLSKFLGEISTENHLTLRTSIIGHEQKRKKSLVEWFLSQNQSVAGYSKAYFSGLTTICVAKALEENLLFNDLSGIYHLSADRIDKHTLLTKIRDVYRKDIEIIPTPSPSIDRSLNCERIRSDAGFAPYSWDHMIQEMYNEYRKYFLND
jgi:dTDP-4-dehydrorhamnose reductase